MSGETPFRPQFRLHTLGTLRLVGSADDTVLGDHGHQRRRLALLAVLAASGERGRSRDQLLGLFWPDVSQSRARHSLDQLLYAIRTSLDGEVFAEANPLRLNAAFIGSDIGDFTDALARGEWEAAMNLYRGPFLEGFYLNDAPEFEQWMDAERGRIERSYTEALERLAKSAEDANDSGSAVRWLQKLIETDPVSSKYATALIRAQMNAGDHVAALQYAERYEALVAQELGTSVGPAVAELVAEVRARAKTESVVVRGAAPPAKPRTSATPSEDRVPAAAGAAETSAPPAATAPAATAPAATAPAATAPATIAPATMPPARGDEPAKTLLHGGRRRAALYSIAAIALAALLAAVLWLRPRPTDRAGAARPARSIAVLPLANLSRDSRDAALVDGVTEELLGTLAKIDGLRVIGRTSAFVFRNSNLDARQIADSLRVSNILEGSVQRIGKQLRVQVRLVDARDGSTRWSETYDRELKDVFLVQSEIAAAVARELDLRVGSGAVAALRRGPTRNIAAYELYLRGNDPAALRSDSAARLALDYFKQAVALDTAYAGAYAGMSRMYNRLSGVEGMADSAREFQALSKKAAMKAVSLDDSLAEARAALGLSLLREYHVAAAETELKRAVAIDPANSRMREWLAFVYHWNGSPADALAEAKRAVEIDPLSPSAQAELGWAFCANSQSAQGLRRLKGIENVRPPLLRVQLYTGACHALSQDWPAAIATLRNATGLGRAILGYSLARSGRPQEALAIATEFTNRWKRTHDGAFEIAVVHGGLGNRDQAFEWLNQAFDDVARPTQGHILMSLLADMHGDPRFEAFRRRLRL